MTSSKDATPLQPIDTRSTDWGIGQSCGARDRVLEVSLLLVISCSLVSSPDVHANGAANIHVSYLGGETLQDDIVLVYGDCGLTHPDQSHHEIGRFAPRAYSEKP
jgi:hypothetical protein